MVWYVEFDLVWFGCLDLHRLALVYFGLLCFGLAELGILHTMDHGQTRKKQVGVRTGVAQHFGTSQNLLFGLVKPSLIV